MTPDTHDDIAALLREIPLPAGRVTTERALFLGREAIRRRRNARSAVTAAATIAVIAAAAGGIGLVRADTRRSPLVMLPLNPSASFPSDFNWTVTPLPLLRAESVKATSTDSSGRYIVGSRLGSGGAAVLWDGLVPIALPKPLHNARDIHPVDVNSSGAVVGNASGPEGTFAWLSRDGVATALPVPEGGGSYMARDINDRGDILGWSESSGPVLWPAATAQPVAVSGIDDAYAIGQDGTIGGSLGDGRHPAVVTPDGVVRRLAEPSGRSGGMVFDIAGDWAGGWVASGAEESRVPARWNLRTGELASFPDAPGTAVAVAANGAVVATSGVNSGVFITPDGRVTALPNPAPDSTPSAGAVNADASLLVGNQLRPDGTSVPVIWRAG